MYTPASQVTMEEGKVKVIREGYNTADALGDVPPPDFVARDLPDSTYYYSISEAGELISSAATLPAIAGAYDSFRMYVAVDGDQITGFYNNGRYEGNPNFGCSFLFYGKTSDLFKKRQINIQTLNPFDFNEAPRAGTLKLHSEENELFNVVANLNGDDCWDQNLGLSQIGESPGASFELDEAKPYKEMRIALEEIPVFDETETQTQLNVQKDVVVIVLEEFETAYSVIFFTGNGPTEGYINKGKTRKLTEKILEQTQNPNALNFNPSTGLYSKAGKGNLTKLST
ncbi:MAG: hypothetical protein R8G66_29260 [Cytophagales bacterium]|nr:hypothetical protein [Cytophagales bacterium]